MLVNNHFRKQWQRRVKTWFNQPARKERRRQNRKTKALKIYPRPVTGALRPLVRCPTQKYNVKVRFGHGFTLDELKQAEIGPRFARSIGIAIDYRRRNRSMEGLSQNVQRLKLYRSKLVLFPRRPHKPAKADAKKEELSKAIQQTKPFPYKIDHPKEKPRLITPEEKKTSAYKTLRKERKKARRVGDVVRKAKRAAASVKAETGKGKKALAKEAADEYLSLNSSIPSPLPIYPT